MSAPTTSSVASVRECARDHARVCKGYLASLVATGGLPVELVKPSSTVGGPGTPQAAVQAYATHVFPSLPEGMLSGLVRFFYSSMHRQGLYVLVDDVDSTKLDSEAIVQNIAERGSDATCRRFLACAAYYLAPQAFPVGDGHSAAVALLLKK